MKTYYFLKHSEERHHKNSYHLIHLLGSASLPGHRPQDRSPRFWSDEPFLHLTTSAQKDGLWPPACSKGYTEAAVPASSAPTWPESSHPNLNACAQDYWSATSSCRKHHEAGQGKPHCSLLPPSRAIFTDSIPWPLWQPLLLPPPRPYPSRDAELPGHRVPGRKPPGTPSPGKRLHAQQK